MAKKELEEASKTNTKVGVILPLGVGFQNEDMNTLVAKVNEIIEKVNER